MTIAHSRPAIQIENAFVAYHERVALKGVSLTVQRGEFVVIIGPNGAGKTTLLTVINGLTPLTRGSVRVLGQTLNGMGHERLRRQVGYLPQVEISDRRLPIRVREVVMIGRYGRLGFLHRPGVRDREVVDAALESVGMTHLAGRPIGHLSGGEQQRIAIARCLAQEPELFLLDEPTSSLDWKARIEIVTLVRRLHRERGLTTLFVTHDLDALPDRGERVILIKDGIISGDGQSDRFITNEVLGRLYDLPPEVVAERRPHSRPEGP